MNKEFLKRNWVYIMLFCLIIALNVLPRLEKGPDEEARVEKKAEIVPEEKLEQSLFVDFEEAQRRSTKIEEKLKENLSLYLFYISANLLIVFIFLLGLTVDGFFLFNKFKKRNILRRTSDTKPPPWDIGEIFKIIILAIFFSYLFFMLFGFFLGMLQSIMKVKFVFYKNENLRMVFDTIVLDCMIFVVILGFLWNVYKRRLTSFGFAKKNILKNIFYGISGYISIIPVIFIIGVFVYIILNILKIKPPPQPIVGLFLAEKNVALMLISSTIAAIFGPVIEEIFFRGVMYNAIKRKIGIFWGIFITSVLFSFLHTHAMTYFLVGFVPIAILGAVLAYLYEKTGSLIPSITLHILNNVGSVVMVFLFKYFNNMIK